MHIVYFILYIFLRWPLVLKGWREGSRLTTANVYPRVYECTCTLRLAGYMEYPDSFNGYSLVSEHIMHGTSILVRRLCMGCQEIQMCGAFIESSRLFCMNWDIT